MDSEVTVTQIVVAILCLVVIVAGTWYFAVAARPEPSEGAGRHPVPAASSHQTGPRAVEQEPVTPAPQAEAMPTPP